MVPVKEMTDVLNVVKDLVQLKAKQWVRLKRGIFKDDLAQVTICVQDCCQSKYILLSKIKISFDNKENMFFLEIHFLLIQCYYKRNPKLN